MSKRVNDSQLIQLTLQEKFLYRECNYTLELSQHAQVPLSINKRNCKMIQYHKKTHTE